MELGVTTVACSGFVEDMKILSELQPKSNGRKAINSELWHACAGPLVTLPQPGSLVYYFPQGHSEQLTASTRRTANAHIPTYPCLPSQMMCQLHNVTLQADKESDEIYAQMTLQPVNSESDVFQIPDFGLTKSKQPKEFFCKTLTASDTSTHGGFSVPRRAAEKLFPILDYSVQPPNQELVVQDLHGNTWTFRHIYRGQPKRHLLTTGWSVFVGAKRLKAGDSVLFIRGEKSQLMLGIRRVNRHQTMLPSSVLSADSMHMGVLAAAAHAAANRTKFVVYYNPRACPSEFVVPLAKYHRAVFGMQVSIGMRFGMMFETEDSNKRRYMGTVSGISDLDQLRWPNSKWRNIQVEWDENGCVERPVRVNLWEIECPDNSFPFFSSASASSLKRSYPGFFGWENMIRNPLLGNRENRFKSNQNHDILHDPEVLIKTLFNQNHLLPNSTHSSPVCHHPQPSSYYSALQNILVKNNEGGAGEMENLGQEYITSEGALSTPQQFESSVVELPVQLPNFSLMNFPVQQQQQQQQLEEAEHASVYSNSNFNLPPIFETNVSQGAVEPDTNNSILFADTNNGNVGFPLQSESCDQPPQPQSQPTMAGDYMDGLGWMLMNPSSWESNFQEDEMFGQELLNEEFPPLLGEVATDHPQSYGLKDLTDVQVSSIYSIEYDDNSNNGSTLLDPPSQSTTSPERGLGGTMWNSGLYNASLITPCCSSGNTSPIEESNPSNKDGSCSWKKNNNNNKKKGSSLRTYTKVQKQGSVGRSIDVTRFKDYIQLKRAIANMFGLSCSDDPVGMDWKLVYMDFENDVLLVGDDPWEEFIRCVRCIRILTPDEVRQLPSSDHQG